MSIMINIEQFIKDVENRPAIWNRNCHFNKFFLEKMWEELSQIHKLPVRLLKVKWKGLRDNFRVEYKRMPRNEDGDLLINPEDHDSKWAHFHALLFLTDHMRQRSNNSSTGYLDREDLQNNCNNNNNNNNNEEECIVEPDLVNGLVQNDYEDNMNDLQHEQHNYRIKLSKPSQPQTNKSNDGPHDLTTTHQPRPKRMHIETEIPDNEENKWNIPEIPSTTTASTPMPTTTAMNFSLSQNDDDYYFLMSLHPYMKLLSPSQKLRIRTKIQKLILKDLYKEDID